MVNCTKLASHLAAPLGAEKGKEAIHQHSGFQTMPCGALSIWSSTSQAVWWEGGWQEGSHADSAPAYGQFQPEQKNGLKKDRQVYC